MNHPHIDLVNMKFRTLLKLTYRVHVRVHEDVQGRVNAVKDVMIRLFPLGGVSFKERETYWPITVKLAEGYREKGYLLTNLDSPNQYAVIQELDITVELNAAETVSEVAIALVVQELGRTTFSGIQEVTEYLTEVHAV